MEKKDLIPLLFVSIAGCFCLSAQIAREAPQELAMTKITKQESSEPLEQTNQISEQTELSEPKSAAKRVLEGNDSPFASSTTKSAAKRSMELEGYQP